MLAHLTRDSVSAGDEDEIGGCLLEVREPTTLEALVAGVHARYAFPSLSGGKATWALTSRKPLAVVAQQWPAPRMVPWEERPASDCALVRGHFRIHVTYFEQMDPELVLRILRRLRLQD